LPSRPPAVFVGLASGRHGPALAENASNLTR